jgi:hypothetical protein
MRDGHAKIDSGKKVFQNFFSKLTLSCVKTCTMKREHETINAGVYALFCLWTGLIYVGASAHLKKRFEQHLDLLRLNRHPCKQLQQDWNQLGADCFALFPLELIRDGSDLSARERAWTKKCLIEGSVYNRLNAVTSKHREQFEKHKPRWPEEPAAKNAKEYIFISPTGLRMNVKGLRGICEAFDLNPSHLSKVARNLYVQHKGWTSGELPNKSRCS